MNFPNSSYRMEELTSRESEIVHLIVDGLSSKEIAEQLFISVRTVDNHRARIMDKMGARNTVEVVKIAIFTGFYPMPDRHRPASIH